MARDGRSSAEATVTRYDQELYNAWLAGFEAGWEEGRDDNWPVKWILKSMYDSWRARRRARIDR